MRAALRMRKIGAIKNPAEIKFSMHGIEINGQMIHSPATEVLLKSVIEIYEFQKLTSIHFDLHQQPKPNSYLVYAKDNKIKQSDLDFWNKNKKRIYIYRNQVINYYLIPLVTGIALVVPTILIVYQTYSQLLN